MPVCDAHCHFFSHRFFAELVSQSKDKIGSDQAVTCALEELGWDPPGSPDELSQRWIRELDLNGVSRAALIASIPGDEASVEAAVRAFPDRFVGYAMVNPKICDPSYLDGLLARGAIRVIALFPAMHRFRLDDDQLMPLFETIQKHPGAAVFVHCGLLTVGIRAKLGLSSPFDIRLGNPLDLQRAASAYPDLKILIPHFGAGFLEQALMLANLYPSVHFDTSSSNGWIRFFPGLTLHQVFETFLSVVGAERLLFGTDSSFFPRGWQSPIYLKQAAILRDILSPADTARVLGGNFSRLFPLPC